MNKKRNSYHLPFNRDELYLLPWSKRDNPGGWVEVTDECDLFCPGCYRHHLEGHRPLAEVKKDILTVQKLTNCDRMAIAGGEPLLYPQLVEVIEFIARHNMKPLLLTNGMKLTKELARALKNAGLVKYHFHVDSGMKRPGWIDKNEVEHNELRQYYADLVWEAGGVQCGYNVTISRSNLKYLPDIIDWARKNIQKVHHLSLVAYRAIPLTDEIEYTVNGKIVDASCFQHSSENPEVNDITTIEMYGLLQKHYKNFIPATYLTGTAAPESYKFLAAIHVGSNHGIYGFMGAKAVELVQTFHHFFKKKYFDFLKSPIAGKKLFILSVIDKELRLAQRNFIKQCFRNPLTLFDKVYIQCVSLQQPNEFYKGQANLCDGCLNMMVYKGELIPSCRLDEYRMLGGPMVGVVKLEESH